MPNPVNTDPNRVYAGFTTLVGGMNSAFAPSLIAPNQCAFARDFTFRDGYPKTRPPFANLLLEYDSDSTEDVLTGRFQGACFYLPDFGDPAILFSVAGRLFKVQIGRVNLVSEITPRVPIITTAEFVVPAVNASIMVQVNDITAVAAGDVVFIAGGQYTITNRSGNLLTLTYNGGSGSTTTSSNFTMPAVGATVTIAVLADAWVSEMQSIYVTGAGYFIVNTINSPTSLTVTNRGDSGNAVPTTVINSGAGVGPVAASGSSVLDASQQQIYLTVTNPDFYDLVYLFQAENYIIALANQSAPVIFDGSSTRLAQPTEIPSGVMGIYLWGRIWIALPDRRSFVAGDLVYSSSGTASLAFRDSILKMTENDFLNEGGAFAVPSTSGPLTAFAALATVDTSLGVGNLLAGTPNAIFSVNTPVDRTTWKNVTYPIQTVSLLDYGPQGPRNVTSVNGDLWYRSVDGYRSFMVARQDIGMPGNTPMSREISSIIANDTPDLLYYGSMVFFDNKLFSTVSPLRTDTGIVHRGLVALNCDLLSTMGNKQPPAWDGVLTGLNIYQVLKGTVSGVERAFAFVQGAEGLELWELLKRGNYDQFTTATDSGTSINRMAIQPQMETGSWDFGDASMLKRLKTCELFLDELTDEVTLTIKYRPDQYPTWTTWKTISLCASVSQCSITPPGDFSCQVFKPDARQYAARIMLPEPDSDTCNLLLGKPMIFGYSFQFRLEMTGHARIRRFKPHALQVKDDMQGGCPPEGECQTVPDCGTAIFTYDSHGT